MKGLEDIPAGARAAEYRKKASEALACAAVTPSPLKRQEFFRLASNWYALALRLEAKLTSMSAAQAS